MNGLYAAMPRCVRAMWCSELWWCAFSENSKIALMVAYNAILCAIFMIRIDVCLGNNTNLVYMVVSMANKKCHHMQNILCGVCNMPKIWANYVCLCLLVRFWLCMSVVCAQKHDDAVRYLELEREKNVQTAKQYLIINRTNIYIRSQI